MRPAFDLHAREFVLQLGHETRVMGIINCSPDSFSGDGKQSRAASLSHARRLAQEGADILDIGGESTRPGAKSISIKEEIGRVIPVIKSLAKNRSIPISVDTSKVEVAREALDAGAVIVNNVRGTQTTKEFLKMVRDYKAAIILMHMRGTPATMHAHARYKNVIKEVTEELKISIEKCLAIGIKRERIAIDPGIGFAKKQDHNLVLIDQLDRLNILKCPIVLGTSRKSFIGEILQKGTNQRLAGTLATVAAGAMRGAHIVRVHDVKAVKETLKVTDAILNAH